jgi:hypothetical protein
MKNEFDKLVRVYESMNNDSDHQGSQREYYKSFKDVRAKYKVEKAWHTPWHFNQSGQYVCYLSDNKECYKSWDDSGEPVYVVGPRR